MPEREAASAEAVAGAAPPTGLLTSSLRPGSHSPGRSFTASDVVLKAFTELAPLELYGILQLRSEVFVVEQNCAYLDLDGADLYAETVHAFIPGPSEPVPYRDSHGEQTGLAVKPIGCARLLPSGLLDGPAGHPEGRSIGRVVSDPAFRAGGVGSALVARLVHDFGDRLLTLNGQSHLADFYGKFGFAQSGEEFVEDGIPHLPMRREPAGS